jgi:HSP20 family protein
LRFFNQNQGEDTMGEGTAVKRAEEPIRTIKYASLFDQMENTFNALARRAYEIFESNGRAFGRDLENWFQAEKELLHPVPLNIAESDESFEVKAEVPGFNEKEIEIGIESRRLTITGKRENKKEEKKGKTIWAESCSDQMLRIVNLPAEIERDKVTATVKNGVLELILPKAAKGQPLRIHPKAA